ncbi:MAG: hypothetical protein LBP59_00380 [Planctomycetaceae bacterium]|jgi:hypothetical protein|nr:hypothetical protein [Planctomycetaceae bacterium]
MRIRKIIFGLFGLLFLFCFYYHYIFVFLLFAEVDGNLLLRETFFSGELRGWNVERSARIYSHEDILRIDTLKDNNSENEPVISKSYNVVGSQLRLIIEVRTLTTSDIVVNWTTKESPARDDNKKIIQKLNTDGNWHKVGFVLPVEDMLETVSLRFTNSSGMWAIRSIELYGRRTNPVVLQKISPFRQKNQDGSEREMLRYSIRNNAPFAMKFLIDQPDEIEDQPITLSRNQTMDFGVPVKKTGNLTAVKLTLRSNDPAVAEWFPQAVFPVFLYNPEPAANWITTKLGQYIFEITPDAKIARIKQNNEVVAIIAPIAHHNGVIPEFKQKIEPKIINATNIINVTKNQNANIAPAEVAENVAANVAANAPANAPVNVAVNVAAAENKTQFNFTSTAADLEIEIIHETVKFKIKSKQKTKKNIDNKIDNKVENKIENKNANEIDDVELLEGPVVRIFGKLRSGILPGVEFLGVGDISSSPIDVKPPYNYRGKPNPVWLTMPMATLGADKIAATLTWKNTNLQPTFHSPNTIDYTGDHRMSLIGKTIEAELRIFPAADLKTKESAAIRSLRNYVKDRGLPNLPAAPRNSSDQLKLCLTGLRGAVQSPDAAAWSYATDPAWRRRPYADMFSTIARLTARTPPIKEIESGGADIANDAIYFLTENVEQWKTIREKSIKSILALRNPDGSYLFRTRFPEVEVGATSYGLTAIRALEIMEYVRYTGDERLFGLLKDTLEFLSYCEIPRGGFYQDSPLHTPDLLSSAMLTWLYVWAYEYSGERRYLDLANRFAVCGLAFVYQWSKFDEGAMLYVTIPKLGANARNVPQWFGTSQPRTGIIYAYALTQLANHDKSIDWLHVAKGILHATEKIQFTNGKNIGCLPDNFTIESQHAGTTGINPVAIAILRLVIEQKPATLFVLVDQGDRYVSPFPLKITKKGIEATNVPQEQQFQILFNGGRIINAKGNGLIKVD